MNLKKKIATLLLIVYSVLFIIPVYAATSTFSGDSVSATSDSITIGGKTWYADESGSRMIEAKGYRFYVSSEDYNEINEAYTNARNRLNTEELNKSTKDIVNNSRQEINQIGNVMKGLAPDINKGAQIVEGTPIQDMVNFAMNFLGWISILLLSVSTVINAICLVAGGYQFVTGEEPRGGGSGSGGGNYGYSQGYSQF